MKYFSLTTFIGLCLFALLTACSHKEHKTKYNEYLRPPTMDFTTADTNNIKQMVNQYAEYVKAKDFKSASEMLYKVRHDSIIPYTDEEKSAFIDAYTKLHIYDSRLNNIILRSDKNNEVILLIKLFKDSDFDKGKGISKMMLNPVYKEGKWYLTLLDKHAEGVVDVYDPNVHDY